MEKEEERKKIEVEKDEKMSESTGKYILLEKTKSFYTIVLPYLNLFPKSEKFTLRQRIEELTIDCVRILIKQNYKTNDYERKQLMLEFIANIELLDFLIYQASVFRYISLDAKQNLSGLLKELIAIGVARHKNLGTEKNMEVKNESKSL